MSRPFWTEHRNEMLRLMWPKRHVSLKEIGETLDHCSATTVCMRAQELGLPSRRGGEKEERADASRACLYMHLVEGRLEQCGAPTSKRDFDEGGGRHQYCDTHRESVRPLAARSVIPLAYGNGRRT